MSERYKSREEADAAMKAAFDAIGTAATLLQMADVQRAAEQLRNATDMAWYFDPTTMRDDRKVAELNRKQKLLDAAARFFAEVQAVRDEIIATLADA